MHSLLSFSHFSQVHPCAPVAARHVAKIASRPSNTTNDIAPDTSYPPLTGLLPEPIDARLSCPATEQLAVRTLPHERRNRGSLQTTNTEADLAHNANSPSLVVRSRHNPTDSDPYSLDTQVHSRSGKGRHSTQARSIDSIRCTSALPFRRKAVPDWKASSSEECQQMT